MFLNILYFELLIISPKRSKSIKTIITGGSYRRFMLSVFPGKLVVSLGWFCLTFISRVSICKRVFGVTVLGAATFS